MTTNDIAAAVLECIGGVANVSGSSLCATRLRISVDDVSLINRTTLHSVKGVLGLADRGPQGIEIVFGPNLVKGVYQAFRQLTGPSSPTGARPGDEGAPVRPSVNFQVKITPETPGMPQARGGAAHPQRPSAPVDEETSALLEMLDED